LNNFSWFIVENKILSHLHSVRNSFLTQVVFRAKINKFRLIIFIPPSQKSFCNNSFITLCTGEFHIKVKISSLTFFKMSWVGLGNVMIMWFKTGKIRVFTTVIFPMTVRFLFDHILIIFFHLQNSLIIINIYKFIHINIKINTHYISTLLFKTSH
jgi:hypothetical protein